MKLSDFDYPLLKELIAQRPLIRRDSSRLLILDRKNNRIIHGSFTDILKYIKAQDLVVFNDTKVMAVRLLGAKKNTGGKVDIILSKKLKPSLYEVLVKPVLKPGQEVIFNNSGLHGKYLGAGKFEFDQPLSPEVLRKIGLMPLPPYIKRLPDETDNESYQTVYAKRPGAIAAPTAGLHFTKETISAIKKIGAQVCSITLHIGLGTFRPVKCDDIECHRMAFESFSVTKKAAGLIRQAKINGGRVFAIGTTTTRTLEAIAGELLPEDGSPYILKPYRGNTDIFIYPGYKFKIVDCLLTNFHLPKTTLLMLACAFTGRSLVFKAYQEAIDRRYRFYSYGDAMLIL